MEATRTRWTSIEASHTHPGFDVQISDDLYADTNPRECYNAKVVGRYGGPDLLVGSVEVFHDAKAGEWATRFTFERIEARSAFQAAAVVQAVNALVEKAGPMKVRARMLNRAEADDAKARAAEAFWSF